jgi:hypothetical protein
MKKKKLWILVALGAAGLAYWLWRQSQAKTTPSNDYTDWNAQFQGYAS